jgi:adenylate kinase
MRLPSLTAALLLLLAGTAVPGQTVILLLGPPGAGKTTQAKNLSRKYRIPAISMAEILKKAGGKVNFNRSLKVPLASGEMVNDEVANQLLQQRITQKDARQGFLLDGYPQTAKQAEYLEAQLKERGLPDPLVLLLEVPDAVALERMSTRGRVDDTPELSRRRLEQYRAEEKLVLERYTRNQKKVDGTPKPPLVWQEIQRVLDH